MTPRSEALITAAAVAAIAASVFPQIVFERALRHETITFYDASRDNRPVAVDITVRRDRELQANAGMIKLPVAILNHGNTVKFTEYSFLANVFAARGYIVASIQHDLATDAPLVTKHGEPFVGRLPHSIVVALPTSALPLTS